MDRPSYRLFGNKMWISAGDHELGENIIHLVLARTPGAPGGVIGLSLFIVPKVLVNSDGELGERNDVVLGGLNHKMGYRGNTNALLNFGEGVHTPGGEAGAVGILVGELNHGLTYMFHMMNEARVSVGAGAMALGYTGFLKSLRYAKERPQGRPVTAKDPSAPQIPIIEHADVRRMLLAQKSYVEGALALVLYCGRLLDDQHTADTQVEREEARTLLGRADFDRQVVALPVVPGGEQPRGPGPRRLRVHRRVQLPKIHQQLNPLLSLDKTFLETRPEWL